MNLFVGHESALEYWRSHNRDRQARPSRAFPQPGDAPSVSTIDLEAIRQAGFGSLPVHVEVARTLDRRPSSALEPHVVNRIVQGAFARTANNIYVSTPEFCFLQLAANFDLIDQIRVGFELCGLYALTKEDPGFVNMQARCTPESILAFLNKCTGFDGVQQSRVAARQLLPNSASPMETVLALLLCLPTRYGGYGLPKPKLNHRIDIGNRGGFGHRSRTLYCDICWPEAHFALEYDSDRYHAGAERIGRDSYRRTLLELEGYRAISVTKRQVYGMVALNELARAVASRLGVRLRTRRPDFGQRHHLLRKKLLSRPA